MRTTTGWRTALLLAAGVVLGQTAARGQENGINYSPPDPVIPLPLYHDRPETGGFYLTMEALWSRQTNPIKQQLIAVRGFQDTDGSIGTAVNILNAIAQGRLDPAFQFTNPAQAAFFQADPGGFFGSGMAALDAAQVSGPITFTPGWNIGLGWRFSNGWAAELRWKHFIDTRYSAAASLIPPNFSVGLDPQGFIGADTYLFSPVSNFPVEFSGPTNEIALTNGTITSGGSTASAAILPGFTVLPGFFTNLFVPNSILNATAIAGVFTVPQGAYGVWNGATTMTLDFLQRYDEYSLMVRIPIEETDCYRLYGLIGARHVWFWERFRWTTLAQETIVNAPAPSAFAGFEPVLFSLSFFGFFPLLDVFFLPFTFATPSFGVPTSFGFQSELDIAHYSNVVSNRLYGPSVGFGGDYYVGHGLSLSLDLRSSLFIDFVRENAKYQRGDRNAGSRRAKSETTLVPELGLAANVWWYPIEGVELRFGYDFATFFNTVSARTPVGFDFTLQGYNWYDHQIRMVDGFNAGIAFIF